MSNNNQTPKETDIIDDITDAIFSIEPDVEQPREHHCRLSDDCKICIWFIVLTHVFAIILVIILAIIHAN